MSYAEQQTEWIISNNLKNKGWELDDPRKKNVFFQKSPYVEHQEKLKGKRPDYILYESNSKRPIAIIEAKKGGIDLEPALKQGIDYAKALDINLVFAMNGSYCETIYVPNNKGLILNGNEVRELIREKEALEFLNKNTNEIYTIPKEIVVSREDLIKIFKNLNDVLRGEGLRAGIERFSEFANILFLKLISENKDSKQNWWEAIKRQRNEDILGYINGHVINQIKNIYGGDVFTPLLIKEYKTLRHIIDSLDPLILSTIDTDVKGDAFEYFIEKTTSTENDLGEYFTPRNVVKTIVNLVDPKFKETIYDPFCGTGGFLTNAFHYIKENTIIENQQELERLKKHTLYGREITTTARIAKMNMILHGDGHSGIQQKDSLANPNYFIDEQAEKDNNPMKFDVVITNMPFSQTITRNININGKIKKENHISPLYENGLAKNNGDAVCVLHCLNSLKVGGRMALVVPEGFLFKKELANVRKFLLSKAKLQSVISLPQGTFLPYTGVKTDILYFTNAHQPNNQRDYWFFDAKNIGVSLDNKQRKLEGMNDFNKINSSDIKKIDKEPNLKDNMFQIGFEVINLEKVKANNYNFVGNIYKQSLIHNAGIEYIKLKEVATLIRGISFGKNDYLEEYTDGYIGIATTKSSQSEGIDKNNLRYIPIEKVKSEKLLQNEDILISIANSLDIVGRTTFVKNLSDKLSFGAFMSVIRVNRNKILPKYLFYVLNSDKTRKYYRENANTTTNISNLTFEALEEMIIPIKSIQEQKSIIEELDNYENIINSAKQIVQNWKPFLKIEENWEKTKLSNSDIFDIKSGGTPDTNNLSFWNGDINWATLVDLPENDNVSIISSTKRKITKEGLVNSSAKLLPVNSIIISSRATLGRVAINKVELATNQGFKNIIIKNNKRALPEFIALILSIQKDKLENLAYGATFKEISKTNFESLEIPLPSLDIQIEIAKKVEKERELINYNKELISIFENKIQDKLNSLWEDNNSEEKEIEADKSLFDMMIAKASKPVK